MREQRYIVDTLRLRAPRLETTIAMGASEVLTMLAFAEADGVSVCDVYAWGGSLRIGETHIVISKAVAE